MRSDSGIILILLVVLSACASDQVKYYHHDKWQIFNENKRLAGKPVYVIDSVFKNLNDSSLEASGIFFELDEYRFDTVGLLINKKYMLNGLSFWTTTDYHYDETGYKSFQITHSKDSTFQTDTLKYIVRPFSEGKFILFRSTARNEYDLISFSENGAVKRIDHVKDTLQPDKVEYYEIWKYQNGLPESAMSFEGYKKNGEVKYFYSEKGFLDSIYRMNADTINEKIVFSNDQFGNPVSEKNVSGTGAVRSIIRNWYEYDEKGNWIKKLDARSSLVNPYGVIPGYPYKSYEWTLTRRKILYN